MTKTSPLDAIAAESAVALDGGDVRHAGIVHGGVHVAPLEGVEVGVVVAAGVRGSGYRHGQVGVVVGLHARGHVGEGVARELHAVDAAGTVLRIVFANIRVFALRFVVAEGGAVHVGLAQGAHDLSEIAQTDELVRICHFCPFCQLRMAAKRPIDVGLVDVGQRIAGIDRSQRGRIHFDQIGKIQHVGRIGHPARLERTSRNRRYRRWSPRRRTCYRSAAPQWSRCHAHPISPRTSHAPRCAYRC